MFFFVLGVRFSFSIPSQEIGLGNVCKMTYFASSGTQKHNSINQCCCRDKQVFVGTMSFFVTQPTMSLSGNPKHWPQPGKITHSLFSCSTAGLPRESRFLVPAGFCCTGSWQACYKYSRNSAHVAGFPCLLENPVKFWLFLKFPGPGRSWKMSLVVESPGVYLWFKYIVLMWVLGMEYHIHKPTYWPILSYRLQLLTSSTWSKLKNLFQVGW